ncbi:VOC family protein [Nonomuraea sp. NPDC048916]|uniref:VOC family protein n=1 Tax=Nonomuraea sp. NPDC048916 TaxID=3154232 RepID=UPI0034003445
MAYSDGTPCWAQLLTRDAAAAGRFYTALLGWDCRDQGGWAMARLRERPVAAITPHPEADDPALWTVYLATSDLGAALTRVEAAGGWLLEGPLADYALVAEARELGADVPVEPFDTPRGRVAVVTHAAGGGMVSLRQAPG